MGLIVAILSTLSSAFRNDAMVKLNEKISRSAQDSNPRNSIMPPSILIVEDCEISSQLMYKLIVDEMSCNAIIANNGEEARKVLFNNHVDLILLDIIMPGDINGYDMLNIIKSTHKTKDIPAIMMTGIDSIDSAVRCIELGAEDYLVKPIDPVLLKARINSHLERKALRDLEIKNRIYIEEQNNNLEYRVNQLTNEIKERKRVENELRESRIRLKCLAESVFEGILIHENGNILDANQALLDMFGYSLVEVKERNILDFISKECHEFVTEKINLQETMPYESVGIKSDGSKIDLEIRGKDIPYDDYNARVVAIRDITMRKRNERELKESKEIAEQATKIKDKFVSLVSHDLRAPLGSTLGLLDLLGSDRVDAEKRLTIVGRCTDNCSNLLNMIDQLLNHSRLKDGNITPNNTLIKGSSFVGEVFNRLLDHSNEKGVTLKSSMPENLFFVGDVQLLFEVLHNLLSNAIKFSDSGSAVNVYAPPDGPCRIAVKDTGIGIKDRYLEHLFDDDVIVSQRGTAGEKGFGLGLQIATDIMNAHNGSISYEPNEGGGSIFYMELANLVPRIVVAEDDLDSALIISNYLSDIGAEAHAATSGHEALSIIPGIDPHVLVTDCEMPEMNGFELIESVRRNISNTLPVLVVSFRKDIVSRTRALELGANDYITKPLFRDDFLQRIKYLISSMS